MGNEKWTSRPLEAENMVSPTQKIKFGLVQMPPYFDMTVHNVNFRLIFFDLPKFQLGISAPFPS